MPSTLFQPFRTMATDGRQTTLMTLYSHAGTHMDAGSHFVAGAPSIDAFDVARCVGPAWVVDVSHLASDSRIERTHVAELERRLGAGEGILFRTGWDRHVGSEAYYGCFPTVSRDLARWLVDKGVGLVGIDTCSLAATGDPAEMAEVHRTVLSAGIIVVEGLANLHRLPKDAPVEFLALPLKLEDLDGSPVRAVAWVPE